MDRIANRLGFKLILYTLLSLAIGALVFFIAYSIAEVIVDSYASQESVREQRLEQSAASLQDYVQENGISQSDKEMLDRWVSNERYVMLQIYSDGRIMYDSTMDVDMSILDMAGGDSIQWQKTFTISFSDGVGEAMIYEYYRMQDELTSTIISVVLGVIAFALAMLLLVRRKTKYITQLSNELHILEGGDLSYEIGVKGKDELGDLAQSIDDMRVAMIERQQDEERLQKRSYELVTTMSHDLRSPLTSLIGYLDILVMGKYRSEDEKARYLENSRAKAYQIKDISDKLFEYFLTHEGEADSLEVELQSATSLLDELFSEYIFELDSSGFAVHYTPLDSSNQIMVAADKKLLHRAFDNIFSNIVKYAEKSEPIVIICTTRDNTVEVDIINAIQNGDAYTPGTGIGLVAAKQIFSAHKWHLDCKTDRERFIVHAIFR